MELDLPRTVVSFLGLVILVVGGLAVSGVMATRTVLVMVAPSALVFGLLCLAIGVGYGRHLAGR